MKYKSEKLRHLHYKKILRVERNYEKKTSSLEEKLNKNKHKIYDNYNSDISGGTKKEKWYTNGIETNC